MDSLVVKHSIYNVFQVQDTDAGEWICFAYNRVTYARRSVRILVRLPEPGRMEFYRKPVDQYVKRGHTAIFNCQVNQTMEYCNYNR